MAMMHFKEPRFNKLNKPQMGFSRLVEARVRPEGEGLTEFAFFFFFFCV